MFFVGEKYHDLFRFMMMMSVKYRESANVSQVKGVCYFLGNEDLLNSNVVKCTDKSGA